MFFFFLGGDDPGDRLTLEYGYEQAIDLGAFANSLAALDRLWEEMQPDTKLALTTVRSGSAIADFVPYVMTAGTAVLATIGAANTISDFVRKTGKALKAFSEIDAAPVATPGLIEPEDLLELIDAVADSGGEFALRHTRKIEGQSKEEIVLEARLEPRALGIARTHLREVVEERELIEAERFAKTAQVYHGVDLYLDQISREPGKAAGRSRDRAIVPEVSPKALPLFFERGSGLKERILEATENPLRTRFTVDVRVNLVGREPRSYEVLAHHHAYLLDER